MEQRRNDGWVAEFSDIATRGFPSRFDTTIHDPRLASPRTGIAWSAPFVQFLSLAYRPHQVIAALPDEHVVSTPHQAFRMSHDSARASLFLKPLKDLALERARLVVQNPRVRSSRGWDLSSREWRFAIEAMPVRENTYRAGVELLEISLPDILQRALDPARTLPDHVSVIRADVALGLDAPMDRRSLEGRRLGITRLEVSDLSVRWGDLSLSASGDLDVADDGVPYGEIMLRAAEWRSVLDVAEQAGRFRPELRDMLESALALMSGPADVLELPLAFSGGQVRLGVIPLGKAPPLPAW